MGERLAGISNKLDSIAEVEDIIDKIEKSYRKFKSHVERDPKKVHDYVQKIIVRLNEIDKHGKFNNKPEYVKIATVHNFLGRIGKGKNLPDNIIPFLRDYLNIPETVASITKKSKDSKPAESENDKTEEMPEEEDGHPESAKEKEEHSLDKALKMSTKEELIGISDKDLANIVHNTTRKDADGNSARVQFLEKFKNVVQDDEEFNKMRQRMLAVQPNESLSYYKNLLVTGKKPVLFREERLLLKELPISDRVLYFKSRLLS